MCCLSNCRSGCRLPIVGCPAPQTFPQIFHRLVNHLHLGLHAGRGEEAGDLGAVLLVGEANIEGNERVLASVPAARSVITPYPKVGPEGSHHPMKCVSLQPAHDEGAEGRDGRRVAVVVHDLTHVLDKGVELVVQLLIRHELAERARSICKTRRDAVEVVE